MIWIMTEPRFRRIEADSIEQAVRMSGYDPRIVVLRDGDSYLPVWRDGKRVLYRSASEHRPGAVRVNRGYNRDAAYKSDAEYQGGTFNNGEW